MNQISHKQAITWIDRRLDGLLTKKQLLSLEEHLHVCDSCRAYAAEMDLLPIQLQNKFHARWDEKPGPSPKIMQHVTEKARNIPMTNRISSGIKLSTGAVTLIVLAFAINFVVSRLRNYSVTATGTEIVNMLQPAEDRLLAFASDQTGDSEIYTMRADGSGLTNLTNDPAYDGYPFWSPDGNRIAFISDRSDSTQIYLMDADGSNVTQITNDEGNPQFDINGPTPWSPDGRKLVFLQFSNGERKSKLYSMDIDGTNKTLLTSEPGEYVWPSWSPDGEHIAFTSYESQGRPIIQRLFIVDKSGNDLVELTGSLPVDESFSAGNYYWSRNGTSIFFAANRNENQAPASTVYEANLDGSLNVITRASKPILDWWNGTVLESETPEPALTWLHTDGSQATLELCRSTDQALNIAYKRSDDGNLVLGANCSASGWILYWANPDGTVTSKLMDSMIPVRNDILFNIAWSPDDHFLTFVSLDSDSSNVTSTLYVLDVEQARNDPSIQPLKMETSSSPSWRPIINNDIVEQKPTSTETPLPSEQADARLIAFTAAAENGNLDIYMMRTDGSQLTNLTNNPARDGNPHWSPDGRRIAFESDRASFTNIFLMDADGSNVVQLTNGEAQHYFSNTNPWSPDGSKLLFAEWVSEGEKWMLSVIGVDGLNKTLLTQVPNIYSNPSWSSDGQHVVFLADDPQNLGGNRLYVVDADGQNRRELTQSLQVNEQLSTMEYHWSLEDQSIFFVGFLQTTDPSWTVYEARVADSSLIIHATTKTPLFDWWDGVSVVSPLIWKRSEETLSTLDPYKNCQQTDAAQSGSYMKRSPNGAWLVSAYCPNGDVWLYWVRSDGTLNRQLLNVPIPSEQRTFSDLVWSPDEKFVAFNVFSNNLTDMYILDVEASLNDPSTQPLKVTVSDGNLFSNISWQPIP